MASFRRILSARWSALLALAPLRPEVAEREGVPVMPWRRPRSASLRLGVGPPLGGLSRGPDLFCGLRGARALRALIVLGGVAARPAITSSEHGVSLMAWTTRMQISVR